ncbi:uncharacterized protein LOC123366095 isoform X2 [Mauremys mutica]|uniref:uncharacterized protein LOC123366095 isoform X2 n=1 Tax=Mauremys mutica TaxID=74926 RepID=UPI001D165F7A|nr:uncharacterized protein LOC123366095 isoform X2 [Mauremys mutica]XP_044865149.1 uncharacterized protein LOC123366095 isoform X2 [Mauremys mutica]
MKSTQPPRRRKRLDWGELKSSEPTPQRVTRRPRSIKAGLPSSVGGQRPERADVLPGARRQEASTLPHARYPEELPELPWTAVPEELPDLPPSPVRDESMHLDPVEDDPRIQHLGLVWRKRYLSDSSKEDPLTQPLMETLESDPKTLVRHPDECDGLSLFTSLEVESDHGVPRVDFFNMIYYLLPYHTPDHWVLAIALMQTKELLTIDPLCDEMRYERTCLRNWRYFIKRLMSNSPSDWKNKILQHNKQKVMATTADHSS